MMARSPPATLASWRAVSAARSASWWVWVPASKNAAPMLMVAGIGLVPVAGICSRTAVQSPSARLWMSGGVAAWNTAANSSPPMRASVSSNDTLARMGGDEFAAVFHAATPPLIQSLADGLCTAVREQIPATGTSPIPATISIGAAFFDAGTQTHHEALLAAETALHEAKVAGGDRAIMYEPPQHA